MAAKQTLEAQNPLILRCNRMIEAFAKSDDERDFYLDRKEGFIIYVDLDKGEDEIRLLEKEVEKNNDRYCLIPKLTFYETKKIMEGFINEKVYDIDTKEKLLDIIQSKEARENFLEFIYDHHSELEKWQTYYQERSRVRIIEWLRTNHFHFVFEEDLDLPRILLEKVKKELFQTKVGKDIVNARKSLIAKSKTYYSNEALNPRPKRGRPPKQAQKAEIEPQITTDIYTTVPNSLRGFLFQPELTSASSFSSKFGHEGDLFSSRRMATGESDLSLESLNQKLATLRHLSSKWKETEETKKGPPVEQYQMRNKGSPLPLKQKTDFQHVQHTREQARLNGAKEYDRTYEKSQPSREHLTSGIGVSSNKRLAQQTASKDERANKLSKPVRLSSKTKSSSSGSTKAKARIRALPKAKPKTKAPPKPKQAKAAPKKPSKLKTLRPIKKLKKKN